jgi:choice-of-anchor B domain-containing protein
MKKKITQLLAVFMLFGTVVSAQSHNLDLVGSLTFDNSLSDVWGFEDKTGKEYALVGVYDGFSIVDVSTPSNPIEIQFIDGPESIWRDIKVWKGYAYVTDETSDGLLVVNLNGLPEDGGALPAKNFTDGDSLVTAHNIYIDENGYAYLFGANLDNGGASIYDVDTDPWNPIRVGAFDEYYLHDGFVRGDTMYGGAVYGGFFNIVDVSDKANPVVLATQETSFNFTHNIWPSDDGKTVFTTDEKGSAFIGAYDISDLENIKLLDEYQSSPGWQVIPHNAHVLGDYLVSSYYRDGLIVHDISRPQNMVEIGRMDNNTINGNGFNGSWGAYPFLKSGLLLNTDIERGLEVIEPTYVKPAYFEGVVVDASNNQVLAGVNISISGLTGANTRTKADGSFATGTAKFDTYTVTFTKEGYSMKTEVMDFDEDSLRIDTIKMSPPVSISENDLGVTSIYPNPAKVQFKLDYQLNRLNDQTKLYVYNMLGVAVYSERISQLNGTIIFGENLSPGLYFARISNGSEHSGLQKITKQ